MSEFNPIDEIAEMGDLRSLAKEQQAEIARLKIARIPHKDDDALGLALLNLFIDLQGCSLPEARKHLVGTITATTAPLRDEIARLRGLVGVLTHELESCAPFFSGQSAYGDIMKAASEGRAALEQKP